MHNIGKHGQPYTTQAVGPEANVDWMDYALFALSTDSKMIQESYRSTRIPRNDKWQLI